jgi:hypothetical protein
MRVAILCPGKSLHETWPARSNRRRYQEIIAVTTAIDADAEFTIWCVIDKIPREYRAMAKDLTVWNNKNAKGRKFQGSFVNAVCLAVENGATKLDIYGNDMSGCCNYNGRTGEPIKNSRSQSHWIKRWKMESERWLRLKDKLELQGIEINEIRHPLPR